MRNVLTSFVAFHWMAVFALMAFGGMTGGFQVPGVGSEFLQASSPVTALFSLGFCLVALLFFWTLVTALFADSAYPGDTEEVARVAFASALGVLTLAILVGAYYAIPDAYRAITVCIAALLASYVAVNAERYISSLARASEGEEARAAARQMAAGAAHSSMLSRLSGRIETPTSGGR